MILEFIKTHKTAIIIVLIIILLLYFFWGNKSDEIDTDYELLTPTSPTNSPTNSPNNNSQASLENYIGRQIYLRHDKVTNNIVEPYYLAVTDKTNCSISNPATDCLFNVAVLQKEKNNSAVFKLVKSFADDRYRLMSAMNPVTLHQKINMSKKIFKTGQNNGMCFDDGEVDDVYFEVERNNGGQVRLKYRETVADTTGRYLYYYVGECTNLSCTQNNTQLTRLCLVDNVDKATYFNIEDGPAGDIFVEVESMGSHTQSTNRAVYNEDESIYSLNRSNRSTDGTNIQSVSGVEEKILQGVEKFMSL